MITRLAITDLTRMSAGHVCVAGYTAAGSAVRLSTPRVHEAGLTAPDGSAAIFPSAIIECDLLEREPDPPHTEDYRFAAASIRYIRRLPPHDWQKVIERSVYDSVEEIFEQPILDDFGRYIMNGQGPRSVGTLRPRGISKVTYTQDPGGAWSYRIGFYDPAGEFYRLKITDMTWRYFWDQQRGPETTPDDVAQQMTQALKARAVLLRLGLSRGWALHPDRCFLQVNGVHTFPDYLAGQTLVSLGWASQTSV